MRVFSLSTLRAFWTKHPDAEDPLRAWEKNACRANWKSLADVKKTYSAADQVGRCIVFDIGGNKYRLIVVLAPGRVFIKHVLTHPEYDRETWKKDCC